MKPCYGLLQDAGSSPVYAREYFPKKSFRNLPPRSDQVVAAISRRAQHRVCPFELTQRECEPAAPHPRCICADDEGLRASSAEALGKGISHPGAEIPAALYFDTPLLGQPESSPQSERRRAAARHIQESPALGA